MKTRRVRSRRFYRRHAILSSPILCLYQVGEKEFCGRFPLEFITKKTVNNNFSHDLYLYMKFFKKSIIIMYFL